MIFIFLFLNNTQNKLTKITFAIIQSSSDLTQSISDHLEWLSHLSERVESLHMNTTVFVQVENKFHLQKNNNGRQLVL